MFIFILYLFPQPQMQFSEYLQTIFLKIFLRILASFQKEKFIAKAIDYRLLYLGSTPN